MSLHKPNITKPLATYHIFFYPTITLRYDSAYSELQLQSVVKYSINKINETLVHSCQIAKPSKHYDTPFSQSHLILSFHLCLGLQAILFCSKFHMNQLHLFIITFARAACPTYHQTVFYDLQSYLHQTHVLRRSYVLEKMSVNKKCHPHKK